MGRSALVNDHVATLETRFDFRVFSSLGMFSWKILFDGPSCAGFRAICSFLLIGVCTGVGGLLKPAFISSVYIARSLGPSRIQESLMLTDIVLFVELYVSLSTPIILTTTLETRF